MRKVSFARLQRTRHDTQAAAYDHAIWPRLLLCVTLATVAIGCSTVFNLKAPEGFARFESGDKNRWITADGVRMRVREVDNKPKANLQFWTEALADHLKRRGYMNKGQRCFKTTQGLDACTLNQLLARGTDDWVMSVTVMVVKERIILVEVVGPWARWKRHEPALHRAVMAFAPPH